MASVERIGQLQSFGRSVIATREAAVLWGTSTAVASQLLMRFATSGLVAKISHGLWQIGGQNPDAAVVLPALTNPYPSYVSGWTALAHHGMIEQIPRAIFACSLDRPKKITTALGPFEVHHIHPRLFGGFDGSTGSRSGMARPEKALFDIVYLFSVRQGNVTLPELELPCGFDQHELQRWISEIPSVRLKTLTSRGLTRLVSTAVTLDT